MENQDNILAKINFEMSKTDLNINPTKKTVSFFYRVFFDGSFIISVVNNLTLDIHTIHSGSIALSDTETMYIKRNGNVAIYHISTKTIG